MNNDWYSCTTGVQFRGNCFRLNNLSLLWHLGRYVFRCDRPFMTPVIIIPFNKTCIALFFVFCFGHTYSQVMVGDISSENIYYQEIDTTITGAYATSFLYCIDFDNDGATDVTFEVYNSGGNAARFYGTRVYTSTNQIEFAVVPDEPAWIDTLVYAGMVDADLNWIYSDAVFYLIYEGYIYNSEPPPPVTYYNEGLFSGNNRYMGFRMHNTYGIKYGWFNLDSVSTNKLRIVSYAIEKNYSSVDDEINNQNNIFCYPNPTNSVLFIESFESDEDIKISIHDVRGGLLYESWSSERTTQINMTQFTAGIYVLRLMNHTINFTEKIVKY